MKLSELIPKLVEIADEQGDLDCVIPANPAGSYNATIDEIEIKDGEVKLGAFL